QAALFDLPAERVLLTGNPRTDQLWRAVPDDRLAALGITGPFVVWMPTFRTPRAVGAVRVYDDGPAEDRAGLAELLAGLQERGLPHRPCAGFCSDLDAGGDRGATRRRAVAERIGVNVTATAADDLVTVLVKLGVLDSA